ncbi:peptide/nickel transport system permease protein [Pseudochelatococcus lubricantis]|uniref:Peptide/nickel transport system permease protein n=1 Tax=Pseudochelatococcus lubricantis TaxID=1538102 RepID=A0ABX0V591_9HYPH|nr:ABC transporter permease [Pseudochelatococcus lubricantis]NIJ58945.1 peptide/nickel transport system permease protein [Pseudochelatococcus lubricantis]
MTEIALPQAEPARNATERTATPRARPHLAVRLGRQAAGLWREAGWMMRVTLALGMLLVLAALLAPVVAPFDPNAQKLLMRLRPPIGFEGARPGYLLGTDELGRDILSRSLYGLRMTLAIALSGSMIGMLIGGTLGLFAGMLRGRADGLIMSLVDIQIAVPFTLVALLAVAVFGSHWQVLIAVLGVAYWEQYARIIRGEVLKLREMPFIEAARAAGASPARIAFRHVLPNVVSPIVVMFTLNFSNIVLLESSLSFLGLGLRPPTATLGSMVGIGRDFMPSAPWIVIAPAVFMLLTTFVVQMLGDRLRDRMDVRLRGR